MTVEHQQHPHPSTVTQIQSKLHAASPMSELESWEPLKNWKPHEHFKTLKGMHRVVNNQIKQQLQPQVSILNSQEKQAKNQVCNWLKIYFSPNAGDPNQLPISKTELYCFYKTYAKANNLVIFSIPIFFDVLQ
jgi:hypothetical protein